jgi:hypothetical protein
MTGKELREWRHQKALDSTFEWARKKARQGDCKANPYKFSYERDMWQAYENGFAKGENEEAI